VAFVPNKPNFAGFRPKMRIERKNKANVHPARRGLRAPMAEAIGKLALAAATRWPGVERAKQSQSAESLGREPGVAAPNKANFPCC